MVIISQCTQVPKHHIAHLNINLALTCPGYLSKAEERKCFMFAIKALSFVSTRVEGHNLTAVNVKTIVGLEMVTNST